MEIKVDRNNGEPPPRKGGRPFKFPYMELGIGDSFFVPGRTHRHMTGIVSNARRRGIKLIMRMDEVDGEKGIRIFRQS